LTVENVADMLGCTPDTVRERTPTALPGVKFGRDWVYVESQVIEAVRVLAVAPRRTRSRQKPPALPQRGKPLPELSGEV